MPFDGPPFLDDDQIRLMSDWVNQGARDSEGVSAPVPVGREVRLEGTLTGIWKLDDAEMLVGDDTRIDDNPQLGDGIEVRGEITKDGMISATRVRER
jgi:hypothetical protein